MNIIIIEDSEIQTTGLFYTLKDKLKLPKNMALVIDTANTIHEAESKLELNRYDIAIIDINLKHHTFNGFTLINKLKQSSPHCKIIIRSALGTTDNYRKAIQTASESGMEILDFLSKFDEDETELINIIQNIISGNYGLIVKYKDLEHQIGSQIVIKGDSIIELSTDQSLLLDKFMQNQGQILSYEILYDCYHHRERKISESFISNTVCNMVSGLRKLLSPENNNEYIHNKSGTGYYWGDLKK